LVFAATTAHGSELDTCITSGAKRHPALVRLIAAAAHVLSSTGPSSSLPPASGISATSNVKPLLEPPPTPLVVEVTNGPEVPDVVSGGGGPLVPTDALVEPLAGGSDDPHARLATAIHNPTFIRIRSASVAQLAVHCLFHRAALPRHPPEPRARRGRVRRGRPDARRRSNRRVEPRRSSASTIDDSYSIQMNVSIEYCQV
jgi:hypothetical protein